MYKFNLAWEMFSDRNSDLLFLSGTQVFFFVPCSWHVDHIISHFFTELKIYHQSLIFKFNIFCTTDFLLLKILQNCPKLLEIKMTATRQLKRFVHVFVAVYFFQVLILVNVNLSVILSRSPCPWLFLQKTVYFFSSERQKPGLRKWLFSEEDSLAGNNDQF